MATLSWSRSEDVEEGRNSCSDRVCGRGLKPVKRWQKRLGVISTPPTLSEPNVNVLYVCVRAACVMGGRALVPETFAEAVSAEEVPQSTEALKHGDGRILTPEVGAGCNLFEARKLQKVYRRARIKAKR